MNVILGGCCDHTQVISDEELRQYTVNLMDQSDGLLVGRNIYQLMESAWPAIASSVDDRKPKYEAGSCVVAELFFVKGPVSAT